MGVRSERRIIGWVAGLNTWAFRARHRERDTFEREYLSGVLAAVGVLTARTQPMDPDRNTLHEVMGYDDAIALIAKVAALGDAPDGEYWELLRSPYSQPLAR